MSDKGYTIQEIAEHCGMTAHTLRYYERVGLIQPVGRARNGHRRYSDSDAAWIDFLHCIRSTNMPIREMLRYAELRELGDATSEERRKILEDHQAEIGAQIETLKRAHALLDHKIANYKLIEQGILIGKPYCCVSVPAEAVTPEEEYAPAV